MVEELLDDDIVRIDEIIQANEAIRTRIIRNGSRNDATFQRRQREISEHLSHLSRVTR
jgi:hypothetical protein